METRHRTIAIIVACALFMQNLDSTVLGTALPAIAHSFGLSPVRLHLTMTAYLLSLAVFMPLSGWIVDKYGTRDVFRLAVLVFTSASAACAFAPSLEFLVAARVLQGMGGALMVPVARLALLRAVPKRDLVNAMAWVSVPALIGPVIGPALGGFIVTYASWRWIFWINLPIGLLGIVLATRFFDDQREAAVGKLDILGFVLCGSGVAALMFGLESIGDSLLAPWLNYALFLGAAAALAGYTLHARRTANPIVDLRLLAIPTFSVSIIGGSLFRIGIGAIPFLLPLLLQTAFGYSPLHSGLVTVASGAGALLMKFAVQRVLVRFGFRSVLTWNALLSALSIAICALFTPATPALLMFAVLLIGGFFRSLQFTAINTIAYADLDQRQMSRATGFASMAQQLSLSLGVGLGALVLDLASAWHGTAVPGQSEFVLALLAVAGGVALSALQFARLSDDAGNEVARREPRPRD
jgi:EmrB/QacA subfamily drug resistance transporter